MADKQGHSGMSQPERGDRGLSRKQFLRQGAMALGGVAGLGLLREPLAIGAVGPGRRDGDPRPIPGGLAIAYDGSIYPVPSNPAVHVLPPAIGFDMNRPLHRSHRG